MGLTTGQASHLLRRTGFGPTSAEIRALVGLSRHEAVDRVLDRRADPPTPRPAALDPHNEWDKHTGMIDWWVERMISTATPIVERLALFWSNHFTTANAKVQHMSSVWEQHLLFRRLGFGSFRDLCRAVAVDGAMLSYLDNELNRAGTVQENFGRELLELFTCGIDHHSEQDVVSMARAWTGHNTVGRAADGTRDLRYRFFPDRHDAGPKTLFGITRDWDGPDTIDELCFGVRADATARRIVTRVHQAFLGPDPRPGTVDELTATFRAADLDVATLLRAVLLHDDFWAPAAQRSLVKAPIDLVVDVLRLTGYPVADAAVRWVMAPMGQTLWDPPTVAGWGHNDYWLSTATAWGRADFASRVRWAIEHTPFLAVADDLGTDAGDVVRLGLEEFGILDPTTETVERLTAFVRDARRRFSWSVRYSLFVLVVLSPEFQTR